MPWQSLRSCWAHLGQILSLFMAVACGWLYAVTVTVERERTQSCVTAHPQPCPATMLVRPALVSEPVRDRRPPSLTQQVHRRGRGKVRRTEGDSLCKGLHYRRGTKIRSKQA